MSFFNKSKIAFLLASILISTTVSAEIKPRTPIKHVVVIYQGNRSFDHYFGTYPIAENNVGETEFFSKPFTPTINRITKSITELNQNLVKPYRLSPFEARTNLSNPLHSYTVLQQACNIGMMDLFVQTTGVGVVPPGLVMGHYDGNTVTALWNYAQNFSLSDNFHATGIAGSTVGAINLVSGQTHGVVPSSLTISSVPIVVQGTLLNDVDPQFDQCSIGQTVKLTGKNIGNLLTDNDITWGWFQGGFRSCSITHTGPNGLPLVDYVPHHNPFQYYKSTSNPDHLTPTSVKMIGKTDRANHLYDLSDFWAAAKKGNLPAVSFLRAPAFQNGHPGNSTPLLEQAFLVETINALQVLPQWPDMAIIIAYDGSGGWFDHEPLTILNQSQIPEDALTGPGEAGTNPPLGGFQGRPGYGFRLPFLLISPWAKENYVDHIFIDQTSITKFIEYNWKLGSIGGSSFDSYAGPLLGMFDFVQRNDRILFLDPETGAVVPNLDSCNCSL